MAQKPSTGLGRLNVEIYRSHTQTQHTRTAGRIPLNEWSARRRGRYLHSLKQTDDTNIHAMSRIWTRDASKQAAADVALDRTATGIGRV